MEIKEKINKYFDNELIITLSNEHGLSVNNLRSSIYFSVLATIHQMKLRSQDSGVALMFYNMSKVAAGSKVKRNLLAFFYKHFRYQGIINFTKTLFNDSLPQIEKMLQERFNLSEYVSNRILIMTSVGTFSILGENILEKKLTMEEFREFLNLKLPLYREAISCDLNFPFEHWEANKADLQNQIIRAENRIKLRAKRKFFFLRSN